MRVITGDAKGRRLKTVKRSSTRPTTNLARGAIFAMLDSLGSDWSATLDLYAGSGALGIEALSRGAEQADFVEQNPKACAMISENLKRTGFDPRSRVICAKVQSALSWLDRKYNVIFLDPPYADRSLVEVLERLDRSELLAEGCVLVAQHSRHQPLPVAIGSLAIVRDRRYGDTCVSIYQRGG